MITKPFILSTINKEWHIVLKKIRDKGIEPKHMLTKVAIKKMQPLGTASDIGVITISTHYINTELYDELKNTVIHEICHLVAGIENGHNSVWKEYCEMLGCVPSPTSLITDDVFFQQVYKPRLQNYHKQLKSGQGSLSDYHKRLAEIRKDR